MRLLVVGGTRFVGRYVVEAALANGHDVTLLHRGQTGAGLFPEAAHVLADRDGDLSALTGPFDATVDVCAYFPRQVRHLADALGQRAGQYVYISSVSAYADPPPSGFDESAPLAVLDDPEVDVVTGETYGGLKAVSEHVAIELFGPTTLIIRPTYVVGPDDYTWRFPWWVKRIAAGGDVLAPGPADDPAQVIDARDQGEWIVRLIEEQVSGAFHAVSPAPPFSWGELLQEVVDAVGPPGTRLVWVDAATLRAAGFDDSTFPLWAMGEPGEALASSGNPAKAYAAGLTPRPLAQTIRDTLTWIQAQGEPKPGIGLDPAREREILEAWQAH